MYVDRSNTTPYPGQVEQIIGTDSNYGSPTNKGNGKLDPVIESRWERASQQSAPKAHDKHLVVVEQDDKQPGPRASSKPGDVKASDAEEAGAGGVAGKNRNLKEGDHKAGLYEDIDRLEHQRRLGPNGTKPLRRSRSKELADVAAHG